MPTYEYACRDCGEHLEVVQSFKDDSLTTCPNCQGNLRKVFSAAGIIFKGSGWHVKDYPSKGAGAASGGDGSEPSSGDSSSDGGSGKGGSSKGGSGEGGSGDGGGSGEGGSGDGGGRSKDTGSSASAESA